MQIYLIVYILLDVRMYEHSGKYRTGNAQKTLRKRSENAQKTFLSVFKTLRKRSENTHEGFQNAQAISWIEYIPYLRDT